MKSFTPENITSAFTNSGIFPFNSEIFTNDQFLPSEVTDQPEKEGSRDSSDNDEIGISRSLVIDYDLANDHACSSTSCLTPGPQLQDKRLNDTPSSENDLLSSILPLPKAKPKPRRTNCRKTKSAVITDTPEKERRFPTKRFLMDDSYSSSDGDIVTALSSDSDITETFSESSQNSVVDEVTKVAIGDYVLANVYSHGKGHKSFVGKLVAGPDNEGDFEISFMERSRKIKNGFIFPSIEDIASMPEEDIRKKLPVPVPVAKTKRLSKVLRFPIDLSCVQ